MKLWWQVGETAQDEQCVQYIQHWIDTSMSLAKGWNHPHPLSKCTLCRHLDVSSPCNVDLNPVVVSLRPVQHSRFVYPPLDSPKLLDSFTSVSCRPTRSCSVHSCWIIDSLVKVHVINSSTNQTTELKFGVIVTVTWRVLNEVLDQYQV